MSDALAKLARRLGPSERFGVVIPRLQGLRIGSTSGVTRLLVQLASLQVSGSDPTRNQLVVRPIKGRPT